MLEFARRIHDDESAQAMTEYAILVSFCALSMFALIGPRGEALIEGIMFYTDQIMYVVSLPLP